MLMRHHWGLGIGHLYSHEHHSHPSHSILTDLIEPGDTSEDQVNDPNHRMEREDDHERGGPMEVEDPELGLEERDKEPEFEWDSTSESEDELRDSISSEELELV
jgi:hypothetical protein